MDQAVTSGAAAQTGTDHPCCNAFATIHAPSARPGTGALQLALFDGLHLGMRKTFDVPEDGHFMTITGHRLANFRYSASNLGVPRSDDLAYFQITANNTRTLDQKKALFKRIAELLSRSSGIRPEDIFVNLV